MWKTHTFGVKVFWGEKQFSFIVSSGAYGYFKLSSHHSFLVSTPCPGMPPSSLSKRHCQLYFLEMLLPSCHLPSQALSLAFRTLHNLSPNYLSNLSSQHSSESIHSLTPVLRGTSVARSRASFSVAFSWWGNVWGIQRPGLHLSSHVALPDT